MINRNSGSSIVRLKPLVAYCWHFHINILSLNLNSFELCVIKAFSIVLVSYISRGFTVNNSSEVILAEFCISMSLVLFNCWEPRTSNEFAVDSFARYSGK